MSVQYYPRGTACVRELADDADVMSITAPTLTSERYLEVLTVMSWTRCADLQPV